MFGLVNTLSTEKAVLAATKPSFRLREKLVAILELTKPRALLMIVFTTLLSALIAATRSPHWLLLLHTAFGVALAGGGSLALNQHMERDLDSQMERTASRPLPSGRLSATLAFWVGLGAMISGYIYLWFTVNPRCSIATMICGFSYLYLYTPLKRHSSLSTFVGAIPGGMLPIMGWLAVRNKMEIGAWILFAILFLWQIPHALIISIRHRKDYHRAGMKQLPLISQQLLSYRQMVFNVLILIPLTITPYYFNMTEEIYPLVALGLGFLLFVVVVRYSMLRSPHTAKHVFIALNAYLPILLLAMYLDRPG